MPDATPSALTDAIAAVEHLAWRGSVRADSDHRVLLARTVNLSGVAWHGGIRQDQDSHLTFIEALFCEDLTPDEARRGGELLAASYLGFYDAAAEGIALVDVGAVKEWYGETVEENYPEAGRAFLRFATSYWTLKVLMRRLEIEKSSALVRALLTRIDDLVGPLFFPYHGLLKADPAQREADQRRFLDAFGPKIDIADFLKRNPILIRDRRDAR
jgi:hypothetical protein